MQAKVTSGFRQGDRYSSHRPGQNSYVITKENKTNAFKKAFKNHVINLLLIVTNIKLFIAFYMGAS